MTDPESFAARMINPLYLPAESEMNFIRNLRAAQFIPGGGVIQYCGSSDLIRLVEDGSVGVGVLLRFWQTDLAEIYLLSRRGLLPTGFDGRDRSKVIEYPYQRLDRDPDFHRPYPWNIEEYQPISDQIINDLFES